MTVDLSRTAPWRFRCAPVDLALFGLVVAYAAILAMGLLQGAWLVNRSGGYVASDFLAFWAAGKMALAGQASAAYDWVLHRNVEVAAIGPFAGDLPWLNPPSFLLFVTPFAWLSYPIGWVAWLAATLTGYVFVARKIVPHPSAALGALAFPAVLITMVTGQASFLTAALIGGTLLLLPTRPWTAGLLLGLLTVKPQMGILFPLVLAVGGHWRALAGATLAALALAAASALVFGPETWDAFLTSIGHAGESVLGAGSVGWGRMQSLYGLLRNLGLPALVSWLAQGALGLGLVVALCGLWRRDVPYEIKAAALGVGVVLVEPYVFVSDEVILAIPIAFLARLACRTGASRLETVMIVLACLAILATFGTHANLAFVAALIVGAAVVRRALPAFDAEACVPTTSPGGSEADPGLSHVAGARSVAGMDFVTIGASARMSA